MIGQPRPRLARQRRAAGHTQEALAYAIGVDRSTVTRWEAGHTDPQPWLRPRLARALGVSAGQLDELLAPRVRESVRPVAPPTDVGSGDPSNAVLDGLRQAMVGSSAIDDAGRADNSETLITEAHRLYQHADYAAAARLAPIVVMHVEADLGASPAWRARAAAYVFAAKLATKLGDAGLAWVAADRALRSAQEAGQPALIGLAQYQVACALGRADHAAEAQRIAAEAAEGLAQQAARASESTPEAHETLSVQVALRSLLAVMAGRSTDGETARASLRQAALHAEQLGDDSNWLWTGAGPTNVRIHELAALIALGDTKGALRLGEIIDTDRLPAALRGRRCQVHLELAEAAADQTDDGLSVLHLLAAERVASQSVSHNAQAVGLVRALLSRERRGRTPGLRALATRAGVVA